MSAATSPGTGPAPKGHARVCARNMLMMPVPGVYALKLRQHFVLLAEGRPAKRRGPKLFNKSGPGFARGSLQART